MPGDVTVMSLIPIPYRIVALVQERNRLFEYPPELLAEIIRDVGFCCDRCAKCCTRTFNGHVFLLDRDVEVIRAIDPSSLEPAPGPEFCDQNGRFYVSGYALRADDDPAGSCWFLEGNRCRIYDQRPSVCRIYPYMLHRESDEQGRLDWRQISGLDLHGEYHTEIPEDVGRDIAHQTIEYENAVLAQEISFLEFIREFFTEHRLRHVQKVFDDRMRGFLKGEPITVMVYHAGQLEEHTCTGP
ncbi:MAG: YkgJ family cysteine cluster protein [Methanolinea sp.]|nr:YkgJ family cysteine cluster protein [Methanolinea sp.]